MLPQTIRPTPPQARAAIARAERSVKRRPDDLDALEQARRLRSEYKALRAEDYIRQLVDSAPPLTPEQRDRLAVLLRGGAAA